LELVKNILFDEKISGSIHLALGRAYKEGGGTNESALHWDMIKDLREEGKILIDGTVIQENGKFLI
jgi:aminopeptidase